MPVRRAVYSVCFGKTIKENHVVLLHEINYIPSVSFFLPVIESQGKINASGIIFNFGVKWASGEKHREERRETERLEIGLNNNDRRCGRAEELSCLFSQVSDCSSVKFLKSLCMLVFHFRFAGQLRDINTKDWLSVFSLRRQSFSRFMANRSCGLPEQSQVAFSRGVRKVLYFSEYSRWAIN